MKKLGLLEVSLFKLVVSGSTIRTPLQQTWLTHILKRINLAPGATAPTMQTVGRLRRLQPLTASAPGHMAHVTKGWAKKWFNHLNHATVYPRAPTRGHMETVGYV